MPLPTTESHRKALAALDAAKTAIEEREYQRRIDPNAMNLRGAFDELGAELQITYLRAKLAVAKGRAFVQATDPRLLALRTLAIETLRTYRDTIATPLPDVPALSGVSPDEVEACIEARSARSAERDAIAATQKVARDRFVVAIATLHEAACAVGAELVTAGCSIDPRLFEAYPHGSMNSNLPYQIPATVAEIDRAIAFIEAQRVVPCGEGACDQDVASLRILERDLEYQRAKAEFERADCAYSQLVFAKEAAGELDFSAPEFAEPQAAIDKATRRLEKADRSRSADYFSAGSHAVARVRKYPMRTL
jgi:hypothetical protein